MAVKLCSVLFVLLEVAFALPGYDFVLESPEKKNSPRALLIDSEGARIQKIADAEFSLCLWAFINDVQLGEVVSLVSYSSNESGKSNELLLAIVYKRVIDKSHPSHTGLTVHGIAIPFVNAVPPRNKWTHLCCTASATGKYHFYIDGKHAARRGQPKAISVSGDGYLYLGQDQDKINRGFVPTRGIQGKLTELHMWDKELSQTEVKLVYDCQLQGNVINWQNATWGFYDSIRMSHSTAPCATEVCKI